MYYMLVRFSVCLNHIKGTVIIMEVKREYYQNCSVLGCVTQNVHSQRHTHMNSSYKGPADWVCHIGTLTPCIEAVA